MKVAFLFVAAASLFLSAQAVAADIAVLATGATKEIILELIPQFEKSSGHKVVATWTGTAGIQKRIGDGEVYEDFEDLLDRTASVLRPMMLREPPALGCRHPADLVSLLREGARAAGLGSRDVHDLVRIFTMSVGDLLDDHFETDGLKGSIASTGVVGVWAGPRTPGTAYNLLHHELGELNGIAGAWGHVRGGGPFKGSRAERRRGRCDGQDAQRFQLQQVSGVGGLACVLRCDRRLAAKRAVLSCFGV